MNFELTLDFFLLSGLPLLKLTRTRVIPSRQTTKLDNMLVHFIREKECQVKGEDCDTELDTFLDTRIKNE